jgi:hypothetical protein
MEQMPIPDLKLGVPIYQTVMKLDFNILYYRHLVKYEGWKKIDFPKNIVVNDKLYLDETLKDKVIEMLDCFIKTGSIRDVTEETTSRGFSIMELKDLKGNSISIQDSSAATEAMIWFGCRTKDQAFIDVNGKLENFQFPSGEVSLEERLHMNKKKARELKKIIKTEWKNYIDFMFPKQPKRKNKMV